MTIQNQWRLFNFRLQFVFAESSGNNASLESVAEDHSVVVSKQRDFGVRRDEWGAWIDWQSQRISNRNVCAQWTGSFCQNSARVGSDVSWQLLNNVDAENCCTDLRQNSLSVEGRREVDVGDSSSAGSRDVTWSGCTRIFPASKEHGGWQRETTCAFADWSPGKDCRHESENNEKLEHVLSKAKYVLAA